MALAAVADAKRTSLEAVVRQVLASQGPVSSGTRADYVKFHDDKVSSLLWAGLVYLRLRPQYARRSHLVLRLWACRSQLVASSRPSVRFRISSSSRSSRADGMCAVAVHGGICARRPQRGGVEQHRPAALPGPQRGSAIAALMCTLPTVTPNDANVRTRHGMRLANPCTPNNRHAWRWLRMSS